MPSEFSVLLLMLVVVVLVSYVRRAFVPVLNRGSLGEVQPTKRSEFFDQMRGWAIVAVVCIHLTYILTPVAGDFTVLNDFTNNLLRFALPVFFVSSGALLAAPQYNWRWLTRFYYGRLLALGLPYALVTVGLSIWAGTNFSGLLYNIATGNAAVPLYFVPVLFQLYLVYPLIYQLAMRRWFVWLTLGVSVCAYMLPQLRGWEYLSFATPFLFFFVWGMYMRPVLLGAAALPAALPWVGLVLLYIVLQWWIGIERFYNGQYFYGLAVLVLCYVLYVQGGVSEWLGRISAYIGQRSLWIFLTHFTWLEVWWQLLQKLAIHTPALTASLFVVGGVAGSLLLGFGIHYLYDRLHKIKRRAYS